MPKSGGTIYAIGAVGTSWVKIGSTRTAVEKRLQTLQVGLPFDLQAVAAIPVDTDLLRIEKRVHTFLADERRRGEWFDTPMDAKRLEALVVRAIQYIAHAEAARVQMAARTDGTREGSLLGQRLREFRQQAGCTQKQLEARSGVPQNTISRIELESVKAISSTTLMGLARALHVSTDALLGMDEPESDEAPDAPASRQRKAKPKAKE
jgi:DNA-binding XRE family transcriptional regulator